MVRQENKHGMRSEIVKFRSHVTAIIILIDFKSYKCSFIKLVDRIQLYKKS